MKKFLVVFGLIFLLLFSSQLVSGQDISPPEITKVYPEQGQTIKSQQPRIVAYYSDDTGIDLGSVRLYVDEEDVTDWSFETKKNHSAIEYNTPKILPLSNGNHTIFVEVADEAGNIATKEWTFTVDIYFEEEQATVINFQALIRNIAIGAGIIALAFCIYILYLKRTKKFTFKKYFAQNPLHKELIIIYLPIIIAISFLILALVYATSISGLPEFSVEYVLIIGFFIAVVPFAVESQLEKRRKAAYERGFAQFLFEMADAMRGGLDPTKAIIELSKTGSGVLKFQLERAADAIRLGRPFEVVIQNIVKPFRSELATRYAKLIAEASQVGGETSLVIHRAAKDMDDFLKVQDDRRRQLAIQTTTIYISFVVLLVILFMLLSFFPGMEGINISLIGSASIEEMEAMADINRMSVVDLKRRFFHIVLVNSIGTGLIIGNVQEGKIKYGLMHSIIMASIAAIFFIVLLI